MSLLAQATPLFVMALVPAVVIAHEPEHPTDRILDPSAPWVLDADPPGPRSLAEEVTGVHVPADAWPVGRRDGDMVVGGESFSRDQLAGLGIPEPLPGMAQPPTPGVLYLAMDGVTVRPTCGNGESANGALNCSPLVNQETVFPAYGDGSSKAAVLQKVRGYMADFGLVVATNRPPEWLPYTMAVIGGSASNAGYSGGVCGIANVSCDGLKRNHVSLTFTSCGTSLISDIIAQETSHNWGLEHVTNSTDLLYPTANGGTKRYVDQCMNITGDGPPSCSYVHEYYCPSGGGNQQNSHAEMLGVFGSHVEDDIAPEIVAVNPPNGSVFATSDAFTVSATINENSNFVGLKWTWFEGVPESMGPEYTKCTNKVCDLDFAAFLDPNAEPWNFIKVGPGIPEGTYGFKVEVMDAYGNYDSETITIIVNATGETGTTTGTTDGGGDTSDTGDTDGSDASDGMSSVTGLSGVTGGDEGGGGQGCSCTMPTSATTSWGLVGLLPWWRRRSRRAF